MNPGNAPRASYLKISNTVLACLPGGGRILDFGAGPCDKAAILQWMGYKVTAYDDLQDDWHLKSGNREKILDFARETGVDFILAQSRETPFSRDSFDMVMLHDVLEHLHDSPRNLLNDLLDSLRSGGFLYITVPNAGNIRKRLAVLLGGTNLPRFELFYWYPGAWRGHVREYVRNDLSLLSGYLGLEVCDLRGSDHMLEQVPRAVLPLYLAVTALFPGFKDSWSLVARKPATWRPRKSLPMKELATIIGKSTTYEYDAESP